MKPILILLLFIGYSCSIKINSKPNSLIVFKGQVFAKMPKDKRIEIDHPLTVQITLMKQDSSIINQFITNNDGIFEESINLNPKWNPIILKIKSLENLSIKLPLNNYNLSCKESQPIFQTINLKKDTSYNLNFECKINENPNKEKITKEFIEGRWEKYSFDDGRIAYSGSNNIYIFKDNKFKNINYWFSDEAALDSCEVMSRYNYSYGEYNINQNILTLEGVFSDENLKIPNKNHCRKIGTYQKDIEAYKIKDTLFLGFKPRPHINYRQIVKFIKK